MLRAPYPCTPNKLTTTAEDSVKPSGSAVQDSMEITKKVLSDLKPWQWLLILGAGYLLITDPAVKRLFKGGR